MMMNCYKYKYQGQERQEELGLNWDSFKWRNYMPEIGRFFNVDPLTEKYVDWSPYVFSGNRVIDARELEGLEPYLVSPGVYEWKVSVVVGKFTKDEVSNLLQEVSKVLSQNENLTVNIIQEEGVSYTIDMTGSNTGEVKYVDGQYSIVTGKAPLGKLADVTISSDGNVVTTTHEMAHSAKEDYVGSSNSSVQDTSENKDNLMQPVHSTSSTNTKLTDEQTQNMNSHMNFYQQFLNKNSNE